MRFIQPHHFRNVSVQTIDDVETYVQQEDLFLGFSTGNLLTTYFNDGTISESDHEKFIAAVFAFYCESLRYIFKKMYCAMIHFGNMHNGLIVFNVRMHAGQMLNILLNGTPAVSSSIIYEIEGLYEQFVEFKCLSDDELPTDTLKDAILSEHDDGSIEYRMDTIWYHISKRGVWLEIMIVFLCFLNVH